MDIGINDDSRCFAPTKHANMTFRVDTHQHFWNLNKVEYAWLSPAFAPIYKTFSPQDLEPQIRVADIDKTMLVQSANNNADTVSMLTQAESYDWIGAVVGWVPLYDHAEAAKLLDRYCRHPKFRGVRHLNHDEPDENWLVREDVLAGVKLIEERNLTFDVVAIFPQHIGHVPAIANRAPNLKIMSIELFGAQRCMFGSDWPVAVLNGDYAKVCKETRAALKGYSRREIDAILGGTAQQVYGIS